VVDRVRFLGVVLDQKFNDTEHLTFLLGKGYKVTNIIIHC